MFKKDEILDKISKKIIIPHNNINKIPKGWFLADGNNNTYDLTEMKILTKPIGFYGFQIEIEGVVWIQKI